MLIIWVEYGAGGHGNEVAVAIVLYCDCSGHHSHWLEMIMHLMENEPVTSWISFFAFVLECAGEKHTYCS